MSLKEISGGNHQNRYTFLTNPRVGNLAHEYYTQKLLKTTMQFSTSISWTDNAKTERAFLIVRKRNRIILSIYNKPVPKT